MNSNNKNENAVNLMDENNTKTIQQHGGRMIVINMKNNEKNNTQKKGKKTVTWWDGFRVSINVIHNGENVEDDAVTFDYVRCVGCFMCG